MAWPVCVIWRWRHGQIAAGRDFDLRLDEIDADHPLGHRMLDLEARVHLEKIEVLLLIEKKLQRSRADVTDRARALDGDASDAPPGAVIHSRRRRFFDDFLMASLDRAFPIVEMNDMAVIVGEHLDFDMPRFLDKLLDVRPSIAERRRCFRADGAKSRRDFTPRAHQSKPLAAAPRHGL